MNTARSITIAAPSLHLPLKERMLALLPPGQRDVARALWATLRFIDFVRMVEEGRRLAT